MWVKLPERWIKRLLDLPESGMGYQRVDILFCNGQELKGVVIFNSEELELPEIENVKLHKT